MAGAFFIPWFAAPRAPLIPWLRRGARLFASTPLLCYHISFKDKPACRPWGRVRPEPAPDAGPAVSVFIPVARKKTMPDPDQLQLNHAVINTLQAVFGGILAKLEAAEKMGLPQNRQNKARLEKCLSKIRQWERGLVQEGRPLFLSGEKQDAGFGAATRLMAMAKQALARAAGEMDRLFSGSAPPRQKDLKQLAAFLTWHAFSRQAYVSGMARLAGAGALEKVKARAEEGSRKARQLADILAASSGAGNKAAAEKVLELAAPLPGLFRSQIADMGVLSGTIRGRFTWADAGIPEPAAEKWQEMKLGPDRAAYWEAFGISPEEAAGWMGVRIPDPAAAGAWKSRGVSHEAAGEWKKHGFSPNLARAWMGHGFMDPGEASAWREKGGDDPAGALAFLLKDPESMDDYMFRLLGAARRGVREAMAVLGDASFLPCEGFLTAFEEAGRAMLPGGSRERLYFVRHFCRIPEALCRACKTRPSAPADLALACVDSIKSLMKDDLPRPAAARINLVRAHALILKPPGQNGSRLMEKGLAMLSSLDKRVDKEKNPVFWGRIHAVLGQGLLLRRGKSRDKNLMMARRHVKAALAVFPDAALSVDREWAGEINGRIRRRLSARGLRGV